MIASPSPVQEIAAVASSAQVPGRDQRRVADAARVLAARAAGGGRRGDAARARRARRRRRCRRALSSPAANARCGPRCEPVVGRGARGPASRAKRAAGVADEHHVAAFVEHRARGLDRVADAARARRRRPPRGRRPRMIEASRPIAPLLVQRRAAAGVEDRVVLEHDHRGLRPRRARRRPRRAPRARPRPPARTPSRAPARARRPASARPAVHDDRDVHRAKDKGVRPLYFRAAVRGRRRRRSASTAWSRASGSRGWRAGSRPCAVEPLGADDDRGPLRPGVEVAQRQVEPPRDERARRGCSCGSASSAASASVPPARAITPSNAPAAAARESSSRNWSRRSPAVTARRPRRAAARRSRRSRRRVARGGPSRDSPHRRRRGAPRPRPPARRRARRRRRGSAGCRRSPRSVITATIATQAAAPRRRARGGGPPSTAASSAAISAGSVNERRGVAEQRRATGTSASFALPGLGMPRAVLEAPSAPPAPSTSGPNHSSGTSAPATITARAPVARATARAP